jgi:hypothetical protein
MAQAMGVQLALGLTSISLIVTCVVAFVFIPRMRAID